MAEERVQRRLAAILAADVVGYSHLMETDEAGTRTRFNAHLDEMIKPAITELRGRIVKTLGDGLLLEFTSVVDAVQCAVEIQNGMMKRNADEPDDRRMDFRIGINLGDVIIEGDDIHGDGVNVAARLEALADPGGICISGDVHRQCRGKVDVSFEDLGDLRVKNIAEPVRTYRLGMNKAASSTEPVSLQSDRPSVAVLPFDNMSGDPEQEFFSDGISEDLITALSRVRQIRVVARNSSFSYKGKSPDIRQVSEELEAGYVIEGSVRKAGNRIRVTAQLIDGKSGDHIWAERYDRQITDMFDVQDELTERLVGAIAPGIASAERQRAKQAPPESLDVWNIYQRGMWLLRRRTPDRMKEEALEARALFQRAIERDPNFAPAYAVYAETFYYDALFGSGVNDQETALSAARKAVELDSDDANAHVALGKVHRLRHDLDAAVAEHRLALSLNPSLADAHYNLGEALVHSGMAPEAVPYLEMAIQLSPHDDLIGPFNARLAEAHLYLANHEEAAALAQKALRLRGIRWLCHAFLLSALGHLGRKEAAEKAMNDLREAEPQAAIALVKERAPVADARYLDHLLDGLRKAGLPE